MLRVSLFTVVFALSVALPATPAEPVLSQYRGVTLGDSVQAVVEQLKLVGADVKVVHERPMLVQELTWQPHRFISGMTVARDSIADMALTFYESHLARITVTYDHQRTQGLTDADLHAALGRVYGRSILMATPVQAALAVPDGRRTIGQWENAETRLILWRQQYPGRVGLTITSIVSDQALQDAIAAGVRLHAAEAPARDLARRTAETAAAQAKGEKTRRENLAAFKP